MQAQGPALMEEEETAVLGLEREMGGCAQASADETNRRGQLEWDHLRQEWLYASWVITPVEQEGISCRVHMAEDRLGTGQFSGGRKLVLCVGG